ncbi:xanthine dehydrogenase small subunit [Pseudactinotalea suaedae]|uniref:xanthine dehydrogenase small subunit n=1 Tax=Pseudactinotalea suaedae TaxID=1524924 RepID=UPI0012E1904B|nr:FAD binding domain-containing protein [Pseudactinotalea suaedae]
MSARTEVELAATVNGQVRAMDAVTGATNALDWLRAQGLTGAKEGCAEGECGACAVLVARPDEQGGTRWTAINACLIPAASLDGAEVVTSEGLGTPGELHPAQREMAVRGGSQCGYCTPGFVCSMAAEYYRPDRRACDPGPERGPNGFDVHAMAGNLCRCTGYRPIQDAAFALGEVPDDDPLAARLSRPAPAPRATVLDGETAFVRPAHLSDALAALAETEGAVALAGSTDWGVEANLRHRRVPLLVALDHLPELRTFEVTPERIEIGAALTLSEIERALAGSVPLLEEMLGQFASRLIRNSATLGGNLGTGSPIGDAAPALLALGASLVLTSVRGDREIPIADYFTGYRQSVREPDELIRSVRIPLPLLPRSSFLKIAKRRFDDISSVAVAIAADLDDGVVREVRIGLGGVAATPLRAVAAEDALRGRPWDLGTVAAAATVLASEGTPIDDHRASARYRAAMLEQSLLRFHASTTEGVAS